MSVPRLPPKHPGSPAALFLEPEVAYAMLESSRSAADVAQRTSRTVLAAQMAVSSSPAPAPSVGAVEVGREDRTSAEPPVQEAPQELEDPTEDAMPPFFDLYLQASDHLGAGRPMSALEVALSIPPGNARDNALAEIEESLEQSCREYMRGSSVLVERLASERLGRMTGEERVVKQRYVSLICLRLSP